MAEKTATTTGKLVDLPTAAASIVSVTASGTYAMTNADDVVMVIPATTAQTITVALPAPSTANYGKTVLIKYVMSTSSSLTVTGAIDAKTVSMGLASTIAKRFLSDGVRWWQV